MLLALDEATVAPPVSSWMPYAVPPPTAAATIATEASSATGPRFRFRWGFGAVGSDAWVEPAGSDGGTTGIGRVAAIGSDGPDGPDKPAGPDGCAAVAGCPGAYAGGAGHFGFTGEEWGWCPPASGLSCSLPRRWLSVMSTSLAPDDENILSAR
ncbi:hypothetical protein GCM10027162_39950 [Streptomyces incanus]